MMEYIHLQKKEKADVYIIPNFLNVYLNTIQFYFMSRKAFKNN